MTTYTATLLRNDAAQLSETLTAETINAAARQAWLDEFRPLASRDAIDEYDVQVESEEGWYATYRARNLDRQVIDAAIDDMELDKEDQSLDYDPLERAARSSHDNSNNRNPENATMHPTHAELSRDTFDAEIERYSTWLADARLDREEYEDISHAYWTISAANAIAANAEDNIEPSEKLLSDFEKNLDREDCIQLSRMHNGQYAAHCTLPPPHDAAWRYAMRHGEGKDYSVDPFELAEQAGIENHMTRQEALTAYARFIAQHEEAASAERLDPEAALEACSDQSESAAETYWLEQAVEAAAEGREAPYA